MTGPAGCSLGVRANEHRENPRERIERCLGGVGTDGQGACGASEKPNHAGELERGMEDGRRGGGDEKRGRH